MQSKLLVLRSENHISQKKMAAIIGVADKTYREKENGTRPFNSDEMWAISNFFKLPMDKIFLPRRYQNGNKERKEVR